MFNKIQLVFYHAINYLKKIIYVRTNFKIFLPKPMSAYFITSTKCNSKCLMCNSWKVKLREVPLKSWKKAIDDLYNWCGPYLKINISGGEILLTKYSQEIMSYCRSKFPLTGIISNGYLINRKKAKELISHNFSNINVSLDGNSAKTVDRIRGQQKAFIRSRRAIEHLVKEKKKQKSKTKIITKTIIMGLNIDEMVGTVKWVKKTGADGIYFQPIEPIFYSKQTLPELKKTDLWFKKEDEKIVIKTLDKLIKMKNDGYPILNDVVTLEEMKYYFLSKPSKRGRGCKIDLDTFFISGEGSVSFCNDYPSLGNIKRESISRILTSFKAQTLRNKIRQCAKNCLLTCTSDKKLPHLVRLFKFITK
jgi:MoaA/NifB/PqqE/SkfB family radical SAM enzyme